MTILVTRRRRTRNTSSGIYLSVMSAASICVFVCGLMVEWLSEFSVIDLSALGDFACQLHGFLVYSFGDVTIWILVAFTFDRFVATCYPLRKNSFCTSRRAYIACWTTFMLAAAKNAPLFWTRAVQINNSTDIPIPLCEPTDRYRKFELYTRPWIVIVTVTILPVGFLLFFNVLIIRTIFLSSHMRDMGGPKLSTRPLKVMTVTCLCASFSFIFLMTPCTVVLTMKPYLNIPDHDPTKRIMDLLVYVNYATNFFLYSMTGKEFRSGLMQLFFRRSPAAFDSPTRVRSVQHTAADVVIILDTYKHVDGDDCTM